MYRKAAVAGKFYPKDKEELLSYFKKVLKKEKK